MFYHVIVSTRASGIWSYFVASAVDNSKVSCTICSETFREVIQAQELTIHYLDIDTSNLRKHLQRKHPDKFRLPENSENECK